MFDVQAWLENSTNVRNPVPPAMITAWRALQAVSPGLAARVALRWFLMPIPGKISAEAQAFLDSGRRSELAAHGETAVAWSWDGEPGPRARHAFVIHGWSGRASQLRRIVAGLIEDGWSVHALDAPGHGESSGRYSSLLHYGETLRAAEARWGPPGLVVAHSFGGAATVLASAEGWITPGRLALLAPNGNPFGWTAGWLRGLGASVATATHFLDLVSARVGAPWDSVDPRPRFAKLRMPGLILHDEGDVEVPYAEGRAAAARWPGARMLTTQGLGHRRILHDAAVVEAIVRFAAGGEVGMEVREVASERPAVLTGDEPAQRMHATA